MSTSEQGCLRCEFPGGRRESGGSPRLPAPSVSLMRKERKLAASVAFDTTVTATGNNTGIVVPGNLMEQLGAGRRPAVVVNLNGYEYRTTVGVMGGKHMVSISAA